MRSYLGDGFPLRCFQRLSVGNLATQQCNHMTTTGTPGIPSSQSSRHYVFSDFSEDQTISSPFDKLRALAYNKRFKFCPYEGYLLYKSLRGQQFFQKTQMILSVPDCQKVRICRISSLYEGYLFSSIKLYIPQQALLLL